MPRARQTVCLLAVALVAVLSGCAAVQEDAMEGLSDSVDKARAAKTISSLQTALVTLSLVQAESAGGTVQDMVAALQAKDPTNRYTTAAPTEMGLVQVVGGGGEAVMLAAMSDAGSEGRPVQYVGVWQGGGGTMFYAGTAPPTYTSSPPAGPGWASTLPQ